jgi:methionyl-tRNA formyltransferase
MAHRIVFMGTPEFAAPTLQALLAAPDLEVVGVVTQPDRPAGRGQQVRPGPVKKLALKAGVDVFQPERLRGPEALDRLRRWDPHFHVVAAFGQILRQEVLDVPFYGSFNVHASLLPRWRGAAPIQAAILAGDAITGITTMKMDAGMDTGPILLQASVEIDLHETGQTLHDKLAALGGPLMVESLRRVVAGEIKPVAQDDEQATYAPRITKADGRLDWTQTAAEIDRRVRAFNPWPGAYTVWNGHTLKFYMGIPLESNPAGLQPGEASMQDPDAPLVIGAADGRYAPARLQLEGRKAIGILDFLNGSPEIDGARLG